MDRPSSIFDPDDEEGPEDDEDDVTGEIQPVI